MDLDTFRTKQGPYKDLYARDADAALLTLKARGVADAAAVTCKVETGRGLALAGIHPKVGGSGADDPGTPPATAGRRPVRPRRPRPSAAPPGSPSAAGWPPPPPPAGAAPPCRRACPPPPRRRA